ncbi:MAG: TonB-dependent receptor [Bacteroidetes bacterium]|nr:MAG: TonB-dependent receptor [Bacteroidota bacterium]
MTKHLSSIIFSIFFSGVTFAQTTISGRVRNAVSGEYIMGANVVIEGELRGVSTNVYGFYSLSTPGNDFTLTISFIGYKQQSVKLNSQESIELNFDLEPTTINIGAGAEVIGTRTQNVQSTDLGRTEISVETIKGIPALFGEVDVLKAIQLLPGIQSSGEGNSGFYVRGGGPDQNLILLDNAAVYNASHLFGFFSVFNADAISNVDVHKGAMPARYGGRISSVLDIHLREGNRRKYKLNGGIGLISSRLTVEGPIVEDRSSFIISGRRTYIDILTRPFVENTTAAGSGYYFYDLNAKMNHRFSNKDQIFLSGYLGKDVFSFKSTDAGFEASIPWGNAIASLRWNHLFNDKLFLNMNANYSNYDFAFEGIQDDFGFGFTSGIQDLSYKASMSYYPSPLHKIKTGVDYVFHTFIPTNFYFKSGEEELTLGESSVTYSHETAMYFEDIFDINELIRISAGIRYSDFRHVGPFTRDSLVYDKGELVKRYGGWEPRLSMRFTTSPRSSVKFGFSENYQYVHLASLSASTAPTDVWIPSSDLVKPQWGRQWNGGYFMDLGSERNWEASIEGYYKDLKNLVEYAENTLPTDNIGTNTDNNLVFGDGWSYGVEFFLKKRRGPLNGWVGYTWSKTERLFDDLNNGEIFPAKFDRRHDLSVVLDYTLNEKWRLAGVFVYATGNSISLPIQRYMLEGRITDLYGSRNGYRMANYHRADISATLTPDRSKKREKRKRNLSENSWVFSIYNLYNRANPYFLFFDTGGSLADGSLEVNAKQVSLFPILPSFTWNFKF